MELCITPGMSKLYRLALVGPGDSFEPLSEYGTPEGALAAKLLAQATLDDAASQLDRLMRTPA